MPGNSPNDATEVIIVPNAVRIGDFTLRCGAATPEGRARVRSALEGLPQIARVLDKSDLGALRASDKLGDLVNDLAQDGTVRGKQILT
jgi:hypothetical protein